MAGLTKQHFKAIAEIINGSQQGRNNTSEFIIKSELINRLCDYFKTQNPQFDEAKFKKACLK